MQSQQLNIFGEPESIKTEKKSKDVKNKINQEHLKEFVSIFQEIRIVGFVHDYQGDYKLIGSVLRNAKKYEYDKVKDLLLYLKKYGLKEIEKSMVGYLTWAFLHVDIAKQPYNTIDLNKNIKRGNQNAKNERLLERNKYKERFKGISGNI